MKNKKLTKYIVTVFIIKKLKKGKRQKKTNMTKS